MSYLSTALRDALSAVPMTQLELASQSGLTQQQVNKAACGTGYVGVKVVHRIVAALPSPQNAAVLAAYLRDEIPHGLADLVAILPNTSTIAERFDPIPSELVGPDRELVAYFAQRVGEPTMRAMLTALRDALEAE